MKDSNKNDFLNNKRQRDSEQSERKPEVNIKRNFDEYIK